MLEKGEDGIAASSAWAMRLVVAAVAGTALGILAAEALFVAIGVTFAVWGLAAFVRTGGDAAAMTTGALAAGPVGAVSCVALAAVGFYAWHRVRGRA